jgi:glycosyltransferase involved in cell wall biosynthesis
MKIDILCSDGSPLGIHHSDIFGLNGRVGIGGAELALMTLAEGWTKAGHEVVLYNNPRQHGQSPFEQREISTFNRTDKRDVLIVFRSPTAKVYGATGLKVWWSTDQYTVGDFRHFSQFPDKIVTISPHHSAYFAANYGIGNAVHIDLPVRSWEYDQKTEKVSNRLVFTSVPLRGLEIVGKTFPRILDAVPDASLVITSDYRLWGQINPLNAEFVQMFMSHKNVQFLGAVPRERLIEEQLKAQIHYYPCTYEELFCIAVAESQVAGALPISTPIGALGTTNMGVIIDGDARNQAVQDVFVEKTIEYLRSPQLPSIQKGLRKKALNRFSLEKILREWDEKVFNNA